MKGKPTSLSEEKEPDKSGGSSESKGKSKMSEKEWEELDMRAANQIRLCLAKNVLLILLDGHKQRSFGKSLRKYTRLKVFQIDYI